MNHISKELPRKFILFFAQRLKTGKSNYISVFYSLLDYDGQKVIITPCQSTNTGQNLVFLVTLTRNVQCTKHSKY